MKVLEGAEVLVFILLTFSVWNCALAQNCAIPRIVRISSEIPQLTETASPGTVLVKMSSQNINFVEVIPSSPTSFIGLHLNPVTKELVLTLERPLKNYLDDSRSQTVDFQANLICKDGRNKTVLFQIPFKDENTKVPQFSQREYNGTITVPTIAFDNHMTTTPLDLNVAIFDEDRDEENALVCVKVVEDFHSDAIDVDVLPQQLLLRDGVVIPDQYSFDVSLYFRAGFEEFYKNSAEVKFKLTTWNRISKADCSESTGAVTNYADVNLALIFDDTTFPPVTQNPVTEMTTPPTDLVCYVVRFTSFYYKAVVKDLAETGEGLELEGIWPTKISAVSSSGENVRYNLDESVYFRINMATGRIYFKRVITEEDVGDMEDSMAIVEIRASDGSSSAVVSLIVLFDIDKEMPTTPSIDPTIPVCPPCPTPETPATPIPGECPEEPQCPEPVTCPTDPSVTTTAIPPPTEFTEPDEEYSEQTMEVSMPTTTVSTTTEPSDGGEGCSKCMCSTFTCPGEGLFPDPYSCRSYFSCRASGVQGERMRCPNDGTVFCSLAGLCDWNLEECTCHDFEPPCCDFCPCEHGCHLDYSTSNFCEDLKNVAPDPSCSTARPISPGTCYDRFNNPYIHIIPHPTNCEDFQQCVELKPREPIPYLMHCSPPLLFNFETCNCDWPEVADCYDPYKDAGRRLQCACSLNSLHGDIQNDRCNSI